MNIVYASDNNFAEVLTVSLVSLLENNKGQLVNVYIISQNISDDNKTRIESSTSNYQCDIYFINMPDISNIIGETVDIKRYSESMFSRILLGTLLPTEIERVIYIDCDTLILDSMMSLWKQNFQGKTLGAVRDCRNIRYNRNLGIKDTSYYINSGMLVIDLNKYRENGWQQILVKAIKEYNGLLEFPDNDIICKILQDDIFYFPLRFNIISLFYMCSYREISSARRPQFLYTEAEVNSSLHNPCIVHFDTFFMVNGRPWMQNCDHKMTQTYLEYRGKTAWGNTPLRPTSMTKSRKLIQLASKIILRFVFIRLIGILHGIVRPLLQKSRLKRCRIEI
jgi:lipopolysaccharide biosynthesis glycosyltransferase